MGCSPSPILKYYSKSVRIYRNMIPCTEKREREDNSQ
jgi:hypothetical protein